MKYTGRPGLPSRDVERMVARRHVPLVPVLDEFWLLR